MVGRAYSFIVTEHDPQRPWVILSTGRHTVELDDQTLFYTWAQEQWPAPRFTVQLEPW